MTTPLHEALKPATNCARCKTALTLSSDPFRYPYCDDCAAKIEQEQKAEKEETQRRELAQREELWCQMCPPLYRQTEPSRLPQDALRQVLGWRYGARGLLMLGVTGAGKTRAAWLLLRRIYDEGHKIHAFDALAYGHECARRFLDGTGERWAQMLATAELVFFDDLGKCPVTERVEAELVGLIERRTANLLPVVATTNMTGAELIKKGSSDRGAPMVRRLREFCESVTFPSPGRLKEKSDGNT
jgi:DNA replication protein DnaC